MSLARTITDAVATAIGTLAGVPTIVVREQAWRVEGDTLPLIVVTTGAEEPEGVAGTSALRQYEVVVSVLVARNHLLEGANRDTAKDWREQVRRRLVPDSTVGPGSILAGVAQVWDVDAVNLPAEDETAYRANYETARLGLLYRTSEPIHA